MAAAPPRILNPLRVWPRQVAHASPNAASGVAFASIGIAVLLMAGMLTWYVQLLNAQLQRGESLRAQQRAGVAFDGRKPAAGRNSMLASSVARPAVNGPRN